jgi:hypothetical protein
MNESIVHQDCDVEYRDIPGLIGYRAGSDGTIWSKWKRGAGGLGCEWREIKANSKSGVYRMFFAAAAGTGIGKRQMRLVHRAVLEAFHGECPDGYQACHNNGNPKDNRACNLRWDTSLNNHADRREHGTIVMGEDNHLSKLTEKQVSYIKRSCEGPRQMARDFGVVPNTIYNILKGRTWKHVT